MQSERNFYRLCPKYNYIPSTLSSKHRIVVYGDLHGDYGLTKKLLEFSKVAIFDDNDKPMWIGGDTHIVQVGDQIDRCRPLSQNDNCNNDPNLTYHDENSDVLIMELFNELHKQAILVGGAVISLLGNHELMNAMGIMDYVSYKGANDYYSDDLKKSGLRSRIHDFKPGNIIANMMACTRLAAIIIGSNLFIHGGIIDSTITKLNINNRQDLDKLNKLIREWLLGLIKRKEIDKYLESDISPFWTRVLGQMKSNKDYDKECSINLTNSLKLLKINNIIVGHTPQNIMDDNLINATCNNIVWRVDTSLSKAFTPIHNKFNKTKPPLQYLQILEDTQFEVISQN